MSVKQHYDKHLGDFYAWMVGDIDPKVEAFCALLDRNNIVAGHRSKAIDLGAGHGIQSIALKEAGFEVVAVDFNDKLLSLLSQNQRDPALLSKMMISEILNPSRRSPQM